MIRTHNLESFWILVTKSILFIDSYCDIINLKASQMHFNLKTPKIWISIYRISSNRSRGYYLIFEVQGEGNNQGRALFEGGYYSKIGQNGLNLAKIDQKQPNLGLK